jgi:hypothetical protein
VTIEFVVINLSRVLRRLGAVYHRGDDFLLSFGEPLTTVYSIMIYSMMCSTEIIGESEACRSLFSDFYLFIYLFIQRILLFTQSADCIIITVARKQCLVCIYRG